MNQAKCTTCGAGLTIKQGDKTCVCAYCQTTNIVENALALGKVEVDVTEDIKRLRANLTTFVQQNSIDEILRVSQKLLDWVPQDFVALYFFGYAKQHQNQPRFLYDFYKEPPTHTADELKLVIDHLMRYSELRDKARVLTFLEAHAPKLIKAFEQIHKERENQEDYYANIPRDIFVCFSSSDLELAQSVVQELESDGNKCWISSRNLRPEDADNYWSNIEKAIQNTSLFLVISSADSMRSKDVHQEIELAQKYQSRMIAFKIDDAPHNSLFKHVFDGNKWVKGNKVSNQSYKNLLQRVYEEKTLPLPSQSKKIIPSISLKRIIPVISVKKITERILAKLLSYKRFLIKFAAVIVLSIGLVIFLLSGGVSITLNGSPSVVLSVGETYNELGAVASNARREVFPVDIIGTVNVARPGIYSLTYRVTDANGRVVEVERVIQVVDVTPPSINLSGDVTKTLIIGEFYEDPGASAVDNVDGVVPVTVQGSFNNLIPGTYVIEYSATDKAGNRSIIATRTIQVRIPTIDDLLDRAFTVVTMDINPTIVIFLDASDRVLGVESLNDDARNVLTNYSYLNQSVDQVIDAVISRSKAFLKDEVILIGVQSSSASKQALISSRVKQQIERSAVTHQTPISPIMRTLALNLAELRPVLRQEQPTPAKQEFVNELIQVGNVSETVSSILSRSIRYISEQRANANVDKIFNDTIPPVIRLRGNPSQNIVLNSTYVDLGAIVSDNLETNLKVTVTGRVNTSLIGVYRLTYNATDSAGNRALPVIRTINVVNAPPPPTNESRKKISTLFRIVSVNESRDSIDVAYVINDPDNVIISWKEQIYQKSNNELLRQQTFDRAVSGTTNICCESWVQENTEYIVLYEADIDLKDGFGIRPGQILYSETVKTSSQQNAQQGSINWKLEYNNGSVVGGVNEFNTRLQRDTSSTPVFSSSEINILNWISDAQLNAVMSKSNNEYRVRAESYTLRIEGYFYPQESGDYVFSINNNDHIRFQIGDEILMDSTDRRVVRGTGRFTVTKNLQARKYYYINIVLRELGGPEGLSILWQRPSEQNTNQFNFHPGELVSYIKDRKNIALESKTMTNSGFTDHSEDITRSINLLFSPEFNSEVLVDEILLTTKLIGRFSANNNRSATVYFNNFIMYDGIPEIADWDGVEIISERSVGHFIFRANRHNVALSHRGIPDNMGRPGFVVTLEFKYRAYYND